MVAQLCLDLLRAVLQHEVVSLCVVLVPVYTLVSSGGYILRFLVSLSHCLMKLLNLF